MDVNDFNDVVKAQVERSTNVLVKKADEYASDTDRLANFKVAAELQGITQMQALAGMMAKHTQSVYSMIWASRGTTFPVEMWEEKIGDHINYLLLLRAVVAEEGRELMTWEQELLNGTETETVTMTNVNSLFPQPVEVEVPSDQMTRSFNEGDGSMLAKISEIINIRNPFNNANTKLAVIRDLVNENEEGKTVTITKDLYELLVRDQDVLTVVANILSESTDWNSEVTSAIHNAIKDVRTVITEIPEDRQAYPVLSIVVDSNVVVQRILQSIVNLVNEKKVLSVEELYMISGHAASFQDQLWGWTDISTFHFSPRPEGSWVLNVPDPIKIVNG